MRFPSSEVMITHLKKSEVRIANKQISYLHPLNKADGSARSHSHSFSREVILTYFAPKWHCARMALRPNAYAQMSRAQMSCTYFLLSILAYSTEKICGLKKNVRVSTSNKNRSAFLATAVDILRKELHFFHRRIVKNYLSWRTLVG